MVPNLLKSIFSLGFAHPFDGQSDFGSVPWYRPGKAETNLL